MFYKLFFLKAGQISGMNQGERLKSLYLVSNVRVKSQDKTA